MYVCVGGGGGGQGEKGVWTCASLLAEVQHQPEAAIDDEENRNDEGGQP